MSNSKFSAPQKAGDGGAVPFVDRFCENCQHWCERYALTGRWTADGQRERETDGDCRIRPPIMGPEGVGRWPRTEPTGWCARWQLREEEV